MKTLRNQEDHKELLGRLQKVTVVSQRKWGRMSAHQMICHLADGFRMYLGEKIVEPSRKSPLVPMVQWVALWAPIPWPHGYRTMPELDQENGGTRPQAFEQDVRVLEQLMERFIRLPADFHFRPHPTLGAMSYRGWMRLGYLHSDHHLRQFGC